MLIQKLKKHWLAVFSVTLSLLVALFWLALRVNWSGISKQFGADTNRSFFIMETPLMLCIIMFLAAVFAMVASFIWSGKRKWPFIMSLSLSGVFLVLEIVVVIMGAKDYVAFILPKFGESVLIALCLAVFGLLLFFPPTGRGRLCTALKCATLSVAVLGTVLIAFDVKANYFTYEAVVYAVEDEYQIVFSTNDESLAWVEINGERYYDLYAGSMKSKDLVHKVTVPQKKLDQAGKYTIGAQTMIYRGPFGGYKGREFTKEYSFRPVDSSDGLVFYTMSDVHGSRKGAARAAANVKDMDFLVILGDSYTMIDSEYDAQFTNLLAFDTTKGEIPVVYARGNHEIKGLYAEDLYKYVGSKNGNFYYEFTFGNYDGGSKDVFGITLDIGEDHDDDWWEYYGTAQFQQYQAEQTAMLKDIADSNKNDGFKYTVACCHIPVQFINQRGNHAEVKETWTALLNEIAPDLVVSGHQHDLYPFLQNDELGNVRTENNADGKLTYNAEFKPNKTFKGRVTDYLFNSFIAGRRGTTQTDKVGALNKRDHIGLETRADLAAGTQTHVYWNAQGQKVSVYNPFVDGEAKTEFTTKLK